MKSAPTCHAPARPGRQLLRSLHRVWNNEWHPGTGWDDLEVPAAPLPDLARLPEVPIERQRVLVVDDNPLNLMLASEMLHAFGVTPLLAADGAEAVALAAELSLGFIMMDLQMPVLDGLAALRQIRAQEGLQQRARVPVVAYTSSAPALHVLLQCGFDGVLDKPCSPLALQSQLLRWCPQVLDAAGVGAWRVGARTHSPVA